MTDLEATVFAYFVAGPAAEWAMVGRFWPRGELTMILEDKVAVSVRKFGPKPVACGKAVAEALLDKLIEAEAFSTQKNKFGGTMHQYQADAYPVVLKAIQDADPIVQASVGKGPEFWDEAFAAQTA